MPGRKGWFEDLHWQQGIYNSWQDALHSSASLAAIKRRLLDTWTLYTRVQACSLAHRSSLRQLLQRCLPVLLRRHMQTCMPCGLHTQHLVRRSLTQDGPSGLKGGLLQHRVYSARHWHAPATGSSEAEAREHHQEQQSQQAPQDRHRHHNYCFERLPAALRRVNKTERVQWGPGAVT